MGVGCRPERIPEMKVSKEVIEKLNVSTFATHQDKRLEREKAEHQARKKWCLDPKRFSSWIRLVRLHARVKRVVLNIKNLIKRQDNKELLPEKKRRKISFVRHRGRHFEKNMKLYGRRNQSHNEALYLSLTLHSTNKDHSFRQSFEICRASPIRCSLSCNTAKRSLDDKADCKILPRTGESQRGYQLCVIPN